MSVTISAVPKARLIEISGDVALTIDFPGAVPAPGFIARARDPELFYIAFSDGTLLRGNAKGEFVVEVAGAGIVDTADGSATLNWSIEWAALVDPDHVITPYQSAVIAAEKGLNVGERVDYAPGVDTL